MRLLSFNLLLINRQDKPVVECTSGPKKPAGAIWDIAWLNGDGQKRETLVTASADGKICQWKVSKVKMLNEQGIVARI